MQFVSCRKPCRASRHLPLDLHLAATFEQLPPRAGYAAASRHAVPAARGSRSRRRLLWQGLGDGSTSSLLGHRWHLRSSRPRGCAPSSCMHVAAIAKIVIASSTAISLYALSHAEITEAAQASSWCSPCIASPPIVCGPLVLQHVTLWAPGLSLGWQRRCRTPLHMRRGSWQTAARNISLGPRFRGGDRSPQGLPLLCERRVGRRRWRWQPSPDRGRGGGLCLCAGLSSTAWRSSLRLLVLLTRPAGGRAGSSSRPPLRGHPGRRATLLSPGSTAACATSWRGGGGSFWQVLEHSQATAKELAVLLPLRMLVLVGAEELEQACIVGWDIEADARVQLA